MQHPSDTITSAVEPRTIALVVPTLENPYFQDMVEAAQEEVAKHSNVRLVVEAAAGGVKDVEGQIVITDKFISKKVDTLIIIPSDSNAIIPTILKANKADIPVVVLDNNINGVEAQKVGAYSATYIGSNNYEGGKKAGEIVMQSIAGSGKVVLLEGVRGAQAAIDRKKGFIDYVSQFPTIEIVASESANWDRREGYKISKMILKDHPDISAIFASNDEMALGATEAIREFGEIDRIKVVGYDGTNEAVKAIEAGLMIASISQEPKKMGCLGVMKSIEIIENVVSVPKQHIILPFEKMKKVIDEIEPFCKGLVFTGDTGDPLVNPYTLDAAQYAKEKGISVGLITNGQVVNQERADRMVQMFTWIRFSINASKPEGYQLIQGVGESEFKRVWTNGRMLCAARDMHHSSCTIGAKFLTDAHRIPEMALFAKMAKEAGFNYCEYKPFHASVTDMREYIQLIREKYEDENFKVIGTVQDYVDMEKRHNKKAEYDVAYGYNFRCVITASLDVYPTCYTRSMRRFLYGNLHRQHFTEIWYSQRRKDVLENLLRDPECPDQCYKEKNHLDLQRTWEEYHKGNMQYVVAKLAAAAQTFDPHKDFVG